MENDSNNKGNLINIEKIKNKDITEKIKNFPYKYS